jgi:chitin synthase
MITFVPSISPLPRSHPWVSQENELWDKESNHSIGSWAPPAKQKNDGYAESRTASLYGRETYYEPRPNSPAHSAMLPPPGYQSGRNTPLSASPLRPMSDAGALYQPTPSRPITNYLDINIPTSLNQEDGDNAYGSPTDADLDLAVQDIMRAADLSTVTKREVRRRLEERFGMDLTSRKAVINNAIDRVLLSHAS